MVFFYCCSNVRRCDAIDRARVVVVLLVVVVGGAPRKR